MKTISLDTLRDILADIHHATPLGIIALTRVKVRKTDNPWPVVNKLVKLNVMTGADFEHSVVRRQERSGLPNPFFTSGLRQWGERISPALVSNVDKDTGETLFYLVGHVNPLIPPRPLYLVPRPLGLGRVRLTSIARDMIANWLPPDRSAEEAARQGLPEGQSPVVYRNWRLDSIVSLALNGQRYRIRTP